mgnify:CR=1 FL=1
MHARVADPDAFARSLAAAMPPSERATADDAAAPLLAARRVPRSWRGFLASLLVHVGLVALATWFVVSRTTLEPPRPDPTIQVFAGGREVGAGIVVAPNMVRPLRSLGLLDGLERIAVRLDAAWEFRRWQDGSVLFVNIQYPGITLAIRGPWDSVRGT